MSLATTKKNYRNAILDGMARSLWIMAYADWAHGEAVCEHCGDRIWRTDEGDWRNEADGTSCPAFQDEREHEPSDTEGPNVAAAGDDWDEAAPETPDAAYLAAGDLEKLLASSEGIKQGEVLPDLFELAMTVHAGEPFEFGELGKGRPSEELRKEREEKYDLAYEFGGMLAMEALGTGVAWGDDHRTKSVSGVFDPAIPDFGCHYDGEELTWEGRERKGTGHSRGEQEARYAGRGEPTEQRKLGRITIVNPGDRAFYDHSYVLQFGAYGDTVLLAYASSLDDALDECVDWLADNAPGLLADDAVEDAYNEARNQGKSEEEAREYAETDTTVAGNAGHHIMSHEWMVVAEDPDRDVLFEIARKNPGELAKNPTGLTKKGERMYEKIRAGYTEVGNQKAKEIAARTVLARAKTGTRGLVKPTAPKRRRRARGRGKR